MAYRDLAKYNWFLIVILLVLGFSLSILYLIDIQYKLGGGMGCGLYKLSKNELDFLFAEYKASILGIKPIYFALAGFPVGIIVSILALKGLKPFKVLFMVSSAIVSVTYIPYLAYLLYRYGIICVYCSGMQIITVLTSILSIVDYILSKIK